MLVSRINYNDIYEVAGKLELNRIEGKTFFLTGVTGFLGSNVLAVLLKVNDRFLKKKCKIIVSCRNKEKLQSIFPGIEERDDVQIYMKPLLEKIHVDTKSHFIVHMASNAVTASFTRIPVETLLINSCATNNLLEYAKYSKCESFLFFSSGAVYGDLGTTESISEDMYGLLNHIEIRNSYAEGKRMGEALCVAYYNEYQVNAKIVRISHTYGPGIDINDGRVFSDFVKKIYENKDLVIKGSGMDVRPFCYITDALSAVFLILFNGEAGECYNMANSKETYDIKQLAEVLVNKAFAEKKLNVIFPKGDTYKRHEMQIVDTSKIESLGWFPTVCVEEGFRRTEKSIIDDNTI